MSSASLILQPCNCQFVARALAHSDTTLYGGHVRSSNIHVSKQQMHCRFYRSQILLINSCYLMSVSWFWHYNHIIMTNRTGQSDPVHGPCSLMCLRHTVFAPNRAALAGVRQDLGNLTRLASQIDGEADLSDLANSAEAAAETGRVLAEKQAEALENVSQELLHSPEIIKWVPSLSMPFAAWHVMCMSASRGNMCIPTSASQQPQLLPDMQFW